MPKLYLILKLIMVVHRRSLHAIAREGKYVAQLVTLDARCIRLVAEIHLTRIFIEDVNLYTHEMMQDIMANMLRAAVRGRWGSYQCFKGSLEEFKAALHASCKFTSVAMEGYTEILMFTGAMYRRRRDSPLGRHGEQWRPCLYRCPLGGYLHTRLRPPLVRLPPCCTTGIGLTAD